LLINLYVDVDNPLNQNMVHLAIYFFAIAAIALSLDGLRNMLAGALRGVHDSKAPMQIGIICLWFISLPVCYLVAFTFKGGPVGLQIGFASGFIVASILLWRRMQKKINFILAERVQPLEYRLPS
jgi:Na+-driven multidrug efflux pump